MLNIITDDLIDNELHQNDANFIFNELNKINFKDYRLVTLNDSINNSNEIYYYFISSYYHFGFSKNGVIKIPIKKEYEFIFHLKNVKIVFLTTHEPDDFDSIEKLTYYIKENNFNENNFIVVNNNSNLSQYQKELNTDITFYNSNLCLIHEVNLMINHKINFLIDKPKTFCCYVRRSRVHRKILLSYLIKHKLIDDCDWSYLKLDDEFLNNNLYQVSFGENFLNKDDFIQFCQYVNIPNKISEYESHIQNFNHNNMIDWDVTYINNSYQYSYINLVTETLFSSGEIHITEKSIKPFFFFQIPIFMATPNHVKTLRHKFNFDMFDDIIDHSYDSETNHRLRFFMIVEQIKKIHKIKILLPEIYENLRNRLIINQNLVLEILKNNQDYNFFKNL
jgi:hypothetical protein